MFYCDLCAHKRKWPESMGKSYGRCEVCGDTRACNDRPSSTLPLPPAPPLSEDRDFQNILARLQERINRL